jgi:hypothetical protein
MQIFQAFAGDVGWGLVTTVSSDRTILNQFAPIVCSAA